jgi:hypothetical protein
MSVMLQPPPVPRSPEGVRKPPVSPMLLSALVCPGAGQLMQRRWVVGGAFMLVFMAGFLWFTMKVLAVLKAYYEFAVNFKGATGEAPGAGEIALPLAICAVVYLAGLIDTALASSRMRVAANRPIS